ncbi:hypothetical protein [Herbidospora mongoliensis]|uniref:hypothetical protein n=1 Tax=Herbidospora mongoliensis TaxID=688067 RepID=UPI00082F9AA5|nr:hypothetical protein [Herbidospora mongoliensis]
MIDYLVAMINVRIHKAKSAPTRGASAVEWAIITAIIAGVALGLAALIRGLVEAQSAEITSNFGGGDSGGGGGGE